MEDGLVPGTRVINLATSEGLNPCCDGRWSRTSSDGVTYHTRLSLNPCCDGRWSRTVRFYRCSECVCSVLILVVVDDGLVPLAGYKWEGTFKES